MAWDALEAVLVSPILLFLALGALNDDNCKPTPSHPNIVVVVHGQSGNFEGMGGVTGALVSAGYCVYAKNYGKPPGGENGQEHLATSAAEIGAFIDEKMAKTQAAKVDVVGHSAGVGVLDNWLLRRGGAAKTVHSVSFGGLHHPYAHVGVPKMIDMSVYLPNLTLAARKIVPGLSIQQVVQAGVTGLGLDPNDPMIKTAESNFTADLFDPDYWKDLHGAHSETEGNLVMIGESARSHPTIDAARNVCYTNIVADGDFLVSGAAGFLDEAANVDNFVLTSAVTQNSHNDMLGSPEAQKKMLDGLASSCRPGSAKTLSTKENDRLPTPQEEEAANAFKKAAGHAEPEFGSSGGCSTAPGSTTSGCPILLFLAAVCGVFRRRIVA